MSSTNRITTLKNKAKLLQKAKFRNGQPIQLKDAFEILAKAAGFPSWRIWKSRLDEHDLLLWSKASAHWHTWYSDRNEARAHLAASPSAYLLPYEKDFFICDADYLRSIGLSSVDPDVLKIGRDWSEPKDQTAWSRVLTKLRLHREHGGPR